MTCRCGHQFCYICLADWDDNHYECGVPNAMMYLLFKLECRWLKWHVGRDAYLPYC